MRKKDGTEYPPNTLNHLQFANFCCTLDREMKHLQSQDIGSKKKQSEPITEQDEELLWEKGLLEDVTPQGLLNIIVYMNGLYFLRSGSEHRALKFPSP